jgi:hypothetical protein
MMDSLPLDVRERIARYLRRPENRARLGATSRAWRSSTVITPKEQARGRFEQALRKVLLQAVTVIRQWVREYNDRSQARSENRKLLGGYSPRQGGVRAEMRGNFRNGWKIVVSEKTKGILIIEVDASEGDRVKADISDFCYRDSRLGLLTFSSRANRLVARKVFKGVGWRVSAI